MNNTDFQQALKLVLVDEGGLDDDPNDHGGRTAHGITQREYNAWRHLKSLPPQDVWKISPDELATIYHDEYWAPWCDSLPAGLDYVFFDDRVNSGSAQAARTLQRVLGVPVDGHMGPITMAAIAGHDVAKLIKDYCGARRRFYRALRQFPRYGRGWLSRVNHVERGADEIYATGSTVRTPLPAHLRRGATARPNPKDVAPPPLHPELAGALAAIAGVAAVAIGHLHLLDFGHLLVTQFAQLEFSAVSVTSLALNVYGLVQRSQTRKAVA